MEWGLRRISRFLLLVGSAAAVLGLSTLHADAHGYDFTDSARLGWAVVYIAALVISAYGVGLPDLFSTRLVALSYGVVATVMGAGAISFFQLFWGDALLPRLVVLGSALILGPWYAVCAALSTNGRDRAQRRDRVVVVADRTEVKSLLHDLTDGAERPAYLVDVIKVSDARNGSKPEPLLERIRQDRGSVLVLSRNANLDESIVNQAAQAHASGIRVRNLVSFYEEWLGKLPVSELERTSVMFDITEIHRRQYLRIKRVLDVSIALIGLALMLPVLPIVIIGNAIASRGMLFYRQARVGKGGLVFEIVKFRTMRTIRGEPANEWTKKDDDRITPFGRFLRKAHIDELPQVMNVLRGDLSIVGPRPEQPQYVAKLSESLVYYDMRHWVRPGVTGWAQVKNGYAGSEQDTFEKLQYDFFYLRHQSLSLDARIIARTLRSVMGLMGR